MATQTLTSDPFQIKSDQLPGLTRPLNFKTTTTFETDANGKIIEGTKKTILRYQATANGVFQAAATSTEGGKAGSWKLINAANSDTPILGASAIKSLQTPNGVLNQATQGSVVTAATKAKLNSEQTKVLSDAAKNNASDTGVTGEQLLASTTAKENTKTRNNFPGASGTRPLVYPITLKYENQDTIKFQMVKYRPKPFNTKTFGFGERSRVASNIKSGEVIGDKQIIGTVVLPIPAGISDTNAVSWGDGGSMNALEAAAANVALTTIDQGGSAGADKASKLAEDIAANSGDVRTLVKNAFAQSALGVGGLLARTTGLVVNPNMELLFTGPTLRPFTFSFKLSARSAPEAAEIRKIIRFFKQGMSPIRTESQLFLKTPHTFQLQYRHVNKEHNFLNQFKECALTSFSVDYTPEGQYATFYDGAMVSYGITMQFQELEPVFNDDYTTLDDNEDTKIGY